MSQVADQPDRRIGLAERMSGEWKVLGFLLGFSCTAYYLYLAVVGSYDPAAERSLFIFFALSLTFCLYPLGRNVMLRSFDAIPADKYPWLPGAVYKAFRQAKDICMREITEINFMMASSPWLPADVERARQLMGHDYWRYGIKENAAEIDTMIRYSVAQGLSTRVVEVEELFAHSTFDYARI